MHDSSNLKVGAKRYCIRTVNDQYINLAEPDPQVVDLIDMAHALGNIKRFLGHTRLPFSVLEHLLNAYYRSIDLGASREVRFATLIHDAHECYVCDVPTPLKHLVGKDYMDIEDAWQRAVFEWAGIPIELAEHPTVKQVDREMLLTEAMELHGVSREELKTEWPEGEPVPDSWLGPWDLAAAKGAFIRLVNTYREGSDPTLEDTIRKATDIA